MNGSPLILGPALAPSCAGLIFVFTFGSRTQGGHQPLEPFTKRYGALFHSTVKDIEKCGDDDCYGSKADVCARNARLSALGQRRTSCLCPCIAHLLGGRDRHWSCGTLRCRWHLSLRQFGSEVRSLSLARTVRTPSLIYSRNRLAIGSVGSNIARLGCEAQ